MDQVEPSGRDSIDSRDQEMAPPLGALRVSVPQIIGTNNAEEKDGETMSLLGAHTANPTWLSRVENGKQLEPRRSSEWQVLAELDSLCCGMRRHRVIEVVHLRHANYGLRWGAKTATTSHQQDHRNGEGHGPRESEARAAPFCVVGPHWWLMTATFTVFLVSALIVTVLTVPHAGPGEAIMGVLLSVACLAMYAKVGCTNPGIVEPLDEPLDDSFTYCDQCESYRPASALHCMDCRVCIEDYDHHCPWTGKCIGKRNVKYFYAWLFFLVLAFVYEMIEFTTYMLPPEDQPTPFDSDDDDSFLAVENRVVSEPSRFHSP